MHLLFKLQYFSTKIHFFTQIFTLSHIILSHDSGADPGFSWEVAKPKKWRLFSPQWPSLRPQFSPSTVHNGEFSYKGASQGPLAPTLGTAPMTYILNWVYNFKSPPLDPPLWLIYGIEFIISSRHAFIISASNIFVCSYALQTTVRKLNGSSTLQASFYHSFSSIIWYVLQLF